MYLQMLFFVQFWITFCFIIFSKDLAGMCIKTKTKCQKIEVQIESQTSDFRKLFGKNDQDKYNNKTWQSTEILVGIIVLIMMDSFELNVMLVELQQNFFWYLSFFMDFPINWYLLFSSWWCWAVCVSNINILQF